MKRNVLGNTGIEVSELSFGTLTFTDLGAEETIRFHFTTRHLAGPAVLLTRVWVDGDVQANYYSFVGWPEREY